MLKSSRSTTWRHAARRPAESAALHPHFPPSVAFQGAPGAFSWEACRTLAPDHAPVPFETFDATFEAVEAGQCALGCVPVRNVIAGPVETVVRRLAQSPLKVLQEVDLPVRMCLLACPGVRIEDLRLIASHEMALKQCGRYIGRLRVRLEAAFDTAGAARDLAAAGDPARGVLAPFGAAAIYGLAVLAEGVQDDSANRTTFLVLAA